MYGVQSCFHFVRMTCERVYASIHVRVGDLAGLWKRYEVYVYFVAVLGNLGHVLKICRG